MKMRHFLLTSMALLLTAFAWAQQGTVTIHQDPTLDKLLYQNKKAATTQTEEALLATGYRVQIYSSNASRKAKETATQWKTDLETAFPNLKTYLVYQAPFWKVRVGDFTHYAEAVLFSKELTKAFPKQAGEIIVVKEKQVKPLYFKNETAETPTQPQPENSL
jgi:hypothetical protein